MSSFDHRSTTGPRAAYLLSLCDSLRQKVLNALEADAGKSVDTMIITACLAGSITRDWQSANRMLAPLMHSITLTARQKNQIKALDIMRELGGWNRKQGAEQAAKLAALGPDITDLLLLGTGSPDKRFRRDVVSALADLADPRSVEHLVEALGDDYSKIRRKAISALVSIGAPAVDALIEALGSDQAQIRGHAALCLGQIHNPKAKQKLMTLLDDEDENVQRRVIRSVRDLVTPEDLPLLLEFVQQAPPEHAEIVMEIFTALGDTGWHAMEDLAAQTQNPIAAYFLAVHGEQRGRDILIALLESKDEKTRYAAIELLAKLSDPHVVPLPGGLCADRRGLARYVVCPKVGGNRHAGSCGRTHFRTGVRISTNAPGSSTWFGRRTGPARGSAPYSTSHGQGQQNPQSCCRSPDTNWRTQRIGAAGSSPGRGSRG